MKDELERAVEKFLYTEAAKTKVKNLTEKYPGPKVHAGHSLTWHYTAIAIVVALAGFITWMILLWG